MGVLPFLTNFFPLCVSLCLITKYTHDAIPCNRAKTGPGLCVCGYGGLIPLRFLHLMEYSLAFSEGELYALSWKNLQDLLLSERRAC